VVNSNNPVFFVDLDETLIHTQRYQKDCVLGKKMKFFFLGGYQTFDAILHPQAHELLSYLRSLTPHVFMLTIAVENYALAANKIHKLGFKPSQIFSREKIYKMVYGNLPDKLKNITHAALIDNLPGRDNYDKMKFINSIQVNRGFMNRYIKVADYIGHDVPAWTLDDVVFEITEFLQKS
jgi:hypothetical protein